MSSAVKLNVVILISGNGSNLQAIIEAIKQGLAVTISAVISNCPEAYGLERARQAGIPALTVAHPLFQSRQAFEEALQKTIDQFEPQIIVLAGFMRKLTAEFVHHYRGRMINIHPSLLPKYPGLDTHRRALGAKDSHHGVSIHYVTEEVDCGPLICQAQFKINPEDNEESLQQRAHLLEHRLYPQVLAWLAAGRLQLTPKGIVLLDNKPLNSELSANS